MISALSIADRSPFGHSENGEAWIPDVVDAIAPSIVQISVRRSEGFGSGTGIVFDDDGKIITNWHIVDNANEIEIILKSGVTLDAKLLREDSGAGPRRAHR